MEKKGERIYRSVGLIYWNNWQTLRIHSSMLHKFSFFSRDLSYSCGDKAESMIESPQQIACDIQCLYEGLSDYYPNLSKVKVEHIQNQIVNGTYTFSPFHLRKISTRSGKERLKNNYMTIPMLMKCCINDRDVTMYINPIEEDDLVLNSLSRTLIRIFNYNRVFTKNTYTYRIGGNRKAFLDSLCKKNVFKVYILDLINSSLEMDRSSLLHKIFLLVKNQTLRDLLEQFFSNPLIDDEGKNFNYSGIPPTGLFGATLFDFSLISLDKEFSDQLPKLGGELWYSRFLNQAFIIISNNNLYVDLAFKENVIFPILSKLSFVSKIRVIEPGDEPVKTFGGQISLSKKGEIKIIDYANKNE